MVIRKEMILKGQEKPFRTSMYIVCFLFLQILFCGIMDAYGVPPASQTNVYINSYDDRSGTDYSLIKTLLTVKNGGTLIVRNLSLDNNSDLIVEAGGVLVVEGDLTTANKMTIHTGGTLIVLGNFYHSGSDNQGEFTSSNPSEVYILGQISPSDLPPGSYPVLSCDTNDALQDYQNGCNYGGETDLMENPVYQAICGDGFDSGEIDGDQTLCDGGSPEPIINTTSATVSGNSSGFSYHWYYSTTLSDPSQDNSSWTLIADAEGLEEYTPSMSITENTYFVRQAQKGAGCVVYSNVIELSVGAAPSPKGIFRN